MIDERALEGRAPIPFCSSAFRAIWEKQFARCTPVIGIGAGAAVDGKS